MNTTETPTTTPTVEDAMIGATPEAQLTTWRNDTAVEVVFTLHTSRRRTHISPETGFRFEVDENTPHVVSIAPGQSRRLLSAFDAAIWQTRCSDLCKDKTRCTDPVHHRGAVIVGGLCPQLTRVGGEHVKLHASLAPRAQGPAPAAEKQVEAATTLMDRARARKRGGR